jgi:hypothetical protein
VRYDRRRKAELDLIRLFRPGEPDELRLQRPGEPAPLVPKPDLDDWLISGAGVLLVVLILCVVAVLGYLVARGVIDAVEIAASAMR